MVTAHLPLLPWLSVINLNTVGFAQNDSLLHKCNMRIPGNAQYFPELDEDASRICKVNWRLNFAVNLVQTLYPEAFPGSHYGSSS